MAFLPGDCGGYHSHALTVSLSRLHRGRALADEQGAAVLLARLI